MNDVCQRQEVRGASGLDVNNKRKGGNQDTNSLSSSNTIIGSGSGMRVEAGDRCGGTSQDSVEYVHRVLRRAEHLGSG